MSDKPTSLRQIFRRGRHKPGDADDADDSSSDSSWIKPDRNNSDERLSPALPVARPPARSPSARVPRKLQKKRSNLDGSASLAPPMSSAYQRDKSPNNEPAEPAIASETSRSARRKERRQEQPTVTTRSRKNKGSTGSSILGTDSTTTSRSGEPSDVPPRELTRVERSLFGRERHYKNHPFVEPPREDSSNDESGGEEDGLALSPMSTKSEPILSKSYNDGDERRRSFGPAFDLDTITIKNTIPSPAHQLRKKRESRQLRRSKSPDRRTPRTPSPVSPVPEKRAKTSDSPVSSLEEPKDISPSNTEAPLLPHERTTIDDTFNPPSCPPSSTSLAQHQLPSKVGRMTRSSSKLQKKPSQRTSRIPTPKASSGKDTANRHDDATTTEDTTTAAAAPNDNDNDNRRYFSAADAEAALMQTLKKLDEGRSTDDEIQATRQEVLRRAAAVLDLPPRPSSSSHSDGDRSRSPIDSDGGPSPDRGRGRGRSRSPVGADRVVHPRSVQYDKPLTLAGGIVQRGFRRWRCCCCQCFTHYESHVCSKLDCAHVRCEGTCERFEP